VSAARGRPRVIVGYDGSPASRAAVRYAADRARGAGYVLVVHAFPLPSELLGKSIADPLVAEHTDRGRAVLDDLMMTDGEALADLDFDVELIGGEPAKAILSIAEINEADEIVMGSRGAGRLGSLLGSVAQDVIHRADIPVVVIPTEAATIVRD